MNKRKVLTTAVAVCLIAILSCGTLAYFTSTKSLTNKFYTASYDPDNPPTAEELFSIKIYETAADGTENTEGLEYEDILPGMKVDKDPTIKNTGKYPAYVRLSVTVTNAAAWKAAFENHKDDSEDKGGAIELEDVFGEFNEDWKRKEISENKNEDTLTYVYYLDGELAAGADSTLFESVTIPPQLTVEEMSALSCFEIRITGDAIQSANTGDNAFEAFTTYWKE